MTNTFPTIFEQFHRAQKKKIWIREIRTLGRAMMKVTPRAIHWWRLTSRIFERK